MCVLKLNKAVLKLHKKVLKRPRAVLKLYQSVLRQHSLQRFRATYSEAKSTQLEK